MGLEVNSFGLTISSVPLGTQPATAQGTAVTPGNLTYGSYAQLLSATSDDSCEVEIGINSVGITATARDCLVTIGWDPAGGTNYGASALVTIPDLIAACASGYVGAANGFGGGVPYRFNLRIPAGSSIAAKAMVNSATLTSLNVWCKLRCRPSRPHLIYVGSFVEAYGVSLATAAGTSMTPGTAARGAYVSLGTLTKNYSQVEYGFGCNDATMSNIGYEVDVAIGDVTNKDLVIEGAVVTANNAEVLTKQPGHGRLWMMAAGQSIFARSQANTTPDSAISVAAYLVGG